MAKQVFSVPNQLTFLRLGFLPFFIIAIRYNSYGWALAILIAAGLSDGLDGLLARKLNQKTQLGSFLDPIADKLLLSSSYLMLAFNHRISWWLAILVLGRDALILIACAVILLVVGYMAFPPSVYGKLNTTFQILLVLVVILVALFPNHLLRDTQFLLKYLVAAFTIFSGFHYSITVARKL
jgi:cardiolipin synthase (CMP-forming)